MITLILGILISAILGYSINFLADLLPQNRRLGRFICRNCENEIGWKEFIFFQKCKNCHKNRPIRFWVVMIVIPLMTFLLWIFPFYRINFYISIVLVSYFVLVFIIDLEHRLIIISLSIFGAIGCFPLGILLRMNNPKIPSTFGQSIWLTILGGFSGFLIMLGIYYLGVAFNRVVAKIRKTPLIEEALGYGDVLVAGIIGLLLGWPGILITLIVAVLLGGFYSGGYIIFMNLRKKYEAFTAIPYAPFLIISALGFLYILR
jgi:leader peptidase (prepilin peptidase) / N-methyltransferase